jgi:hypothetical protein
MGDAALCSENTLPLSARIHDSSGLPTFRPEPENRIDDPIGLLAIVYVAAHGSLVDLGRLPGVIGAGVCIGDSASTGNDHTQAKIGL